jgi:pectate lyase
MLAIVGRACIMLIRIASGADARGVLLTLERLMSIRYMPATAFVLALIAAVASPAVAAEDGPIGFASVSGLGTDGTTGGAGGPVVTVTTADRLSFYASRETPYIIQVQGDISGSISVHDNKTIVGVGERPTIRGQIYVNKHKNVIIRDLYLADANGDCVTIINGAHHVWVDHCDISDSTDGLLDMTRQSDYLTISWCKFYYSKPVGTHRLACLVGSSDKQTADANSLHITMHHNWWAENCIERMPSVRYATMHLFNNYYTSKGNNYCIRSRLDAEVLVENCSFSQVNDPHVIYVARTEKKLNIAKGCLKAVGNVYDRTTGLKEEDGQVFTPPYRYTLDKGEDVAKIVSSGAKPRNNEALPDTVVVKTPKEKKK